MSDTREVLKKGYQGGDLGQAVSQRPQVSDPRGGSANGSAQQNSAGGSGASKPEAGDRPSDG